MMALLMALSFSVFAFAESGPETPAPAEPETDASEFVVFGYYDDGDFYGNTVVSVKLDGTELGEANEDSIVEYLTLKPRQEGDKGLSVEIELEEGYMLGDDEYVSSGIRIFWTALTAVENQYVDNVEGLGLTDEDIELVDGKPNSIRATIQVPSEDALKSVQYLALAFCVTDGSEEYEEECGLIKKVVINAPTIKEGDGYSIDGALAIPRPEVSVPDNAPYYIPEDSGGLRAFWLDPLEEFTEPYDFYDATEDAVFERGQWYYIGMEIYPLQNIIGGPEDDDPPVLDSVEPETKMASYNFFALDEEYWPEVVVNNGELVTYAVYGGNCSYGTDAYLVAVIRVTPDYQSPDTAEIDPLPWVAAMILSATIIITIIDDDRRRYARR